MYFQLPFEATPVKNRREAEYAIYDALYDNWWGRKEDALKTLIEIANYVAERTLDGSYTQVPDEVPEETGTSSKTGADTDD